MSTTCSASELRLRSCNDSSVVALAIKSRSRATMCAMSSPAVRMCLRYFWPLAVNPCSPREHQVRKADDRRERVIDVMRDAAGHLAQRLEPFLLHDSLLGLAQIIVGARQFRVQTGLVRSERHVFAQHPQEFAIAAV